MGQILKFSFSSRLVVIEISQRCQTSTKDLIDPSLPSATWPQISNAARKVKELKAQTALAALNKRRLHTFNDISPPAIFSHVSERRPNTALPERGRPLPLPAPILVVQYGNP